MRILALPSIRPLTLGAAAALFALALVPAHAASPEQQTRTADCSTQGSGQGKSRQAGSGCLAPPCTAPAKAPPRQAGAPRTSRHIPVPGCQLASRGTVDSSRLG